MRLGYEFIWNKMTMSRLDPEPTPSSSSGGSIPEWRREEIRALPQELLGQCLLIMQARERQMPEIRNRPLTTLPEATGDEAMLSQNSAVRNRLGPGNSANCFSERERARQMGILMVMWSRGCVCCP